MTDPSTSPPRSVTLFLAGDVMTGRGIDQILEHPGLPALHEDSVRDARRYIALAEAINGPIPRLVPPGYPWGDALAAIAARRPAARIVNLETALTRSDDWCRGKEIHYRMHPGNVGILTTAGIDVAVLANNHTLDWGIAGLLETLDTLDRARISAAGAGRSAEAARTPAVIALPTGGRIIVAAVGSTSSGIPHDWRAVGASPGLDVLEALTPTIADELAARVVAHRQPGDVAIVSIHWGANWGYEVPTTHVTFAHRLVDAGVDLVHGHSSHHARPIEVYRDRLILYGCGDFLDDYEGIRGYERYRGDLALGYFPTIEAHTGRLLALAIEPFQARRFRLGRIEERDLAWLAAKLSSVSTSFATRVGAGGEGSLSVNW